jgi:hypothetical protein
LPWRLLAAAEVDALLLERRCVGKGDGEPVADIGALGRRGPPRAAPKASEAATAASIASEEALEQVRKVGSLAGIELEVAAPEAACRPACSGSRAGPAIAERHLGIAFLVDLAAVVLRALVLVGEDVIGARHGGKALRRLGIVLVPVGVELLGELPVGLLDVGLPRIALHAQL